jgi:hypothetical protein
MKEKPSREGNDPIKTFEREYIQYVQKRVKKESMAG